MVTDDSKLIIANCSGFYGDRRSAAAQMVRGGPIDVLTGDYLAELTMAILLKKKKKDPDGGFAATFLIQMEEIMGECLDRKIRVVTNAGGLNPPAMATALEKTAERLGLHPKVAYIEGDDLLPRLSDLQGQGESFTHLDKGIGLTDSGATPITANAYMGGWGIAAALAKGADIVVTGRVADAALVAGPAAWHFGWKHDDWDRLAGAYAAGHVIECGTQATGGNYSFFEEVPSFRDLGFPIAEVYEDGSCVITKHPGTGGLVSVGTVTAQLLYEISTPGYLTPDVTARFDTLELLQEDTDRVRVRNTKGEPPPATTKVCINTLGLHRNTVSITLTGLDIEKKGESCRKRPVRQRRRTESVSVGRHPAHPIRQTRSVHQRRSLCLSEHHGHGPGSGEDRKGVSRQIKRAGPGQYSRIFPRPAAGRNDPVHCPLAGPGLRPAYSAKGGGGRRRAFCGNTAVASARALQTVPNSHGANGPRQNGAGASGPGLRHPQR